jgi:predicted transporter
MDLNIILWIGGMLFSLGIFAIKVGFGLGFGRIKWKGIFLTLSIYLVVFVFIAVLSERLIQLLEPVLRKGPYLHTLMAAGMIVWGIYLVRQCGRATERQIKVLQCYSATGNAEKTTALPHYRSAALLLIPCPVCLTAMTFSTWAALNVIQFPAVLLGLGIGAVFIFLTLAVVGLTRLKQTSNPEISLGLGMIVIGIYFISSLFIPAKIEEAKGIYRSFLTENSSIDLNNSIGVFALLFVAMVVGYLMNKNREVKK